MFEDSHHDPSGASATPPPSDCPSIGRGRYAIVHKIAEGGMAGVYRAYDNKLRVWRAIKVLLPEYAQRKTLRARFETEASTMARIDNPHVIRVYDVGTAELLPYMVMELADGGTLNEWVDENGPMPPRLALDAAIHVANGLSAAHAIGVVHRDVKPHNVLVSLDGLCKVTDFGIARITQALDGMTRTGSTMGTIGYMAPEQRADAKVVDARADVYSLGALLFKLVTSAIVTDLFLVEHEPQLLEKVDPTLHEVLIRACFHDRDRRFADMAAMTRTLQELRSLVPQNPEGTKPLASPARIRTGPEHADEFDEIAEILVQNRRSHSVDAPTRDVPLPYTMPNRAARPKRTDSPSVPPAYMAGADLYAPAQTPTLEAPTAPVHDAGDAEPSLGPMRRPVEPTAAPSGSSPLSGAKALAGAAVSAWLLLAAATGFGAWEVRGDADRTGEAVAVLHAAIGQEQQLILDLTSHGASAAVGQQLTTLFYVWRDERDPDLRDAAATAYVTALRAEIAVTLVDADPSDLVAVRVTHIEKAWRNYESAREDWGTAAASWRGRLATGIGLAPKP